MELIPENIASSKQYFRQVSIGALCQKKVHKVIIWIIAYYCSLLFYYFCKNTSCQFKQNLFLSSQVIKPLFWYQFWIRLQQYLSQSSYKQKLSYPFLSNAIFIFSLEVPEIHSSLTDKNKSFFCMLSMILTHTYMYSFSQLVCFFKKVKLFNCWNINFRFKSGQ